MILVFAEHDNGTFKKTAFEAVQMGARIAQLRNTSCSAVVLGNCPGASELGNYGASTVFQVSGDFISFDDTVFTAVLADVATQKSASALVLTHSAVGKTLIGRLSIRLNAGSVSNIKDVITGDDGSLVFTRPAFSGKAFARVSVMTDNAVVSVMSNALVPERTKQVASVEEIAVDLPEGKTKVVDVQKIAGNVPLGEAELVVSAGRGMKGPENWSIIEELATELGAATACSRPVADSDWRPHHEHVGQTGVAIRPNLYIAIGISGAIQHLAGVNSSKTIVVINKDPEAPFFKAADYGVQADLFDVIPKLTEAVRRFKGS